MFPVSKSGKNSDSKTFLRSRFSYKSIGKSKCMSTTPPACSRSIRSSVDVSVSKRIRKKETAAYADVTNGIPGERTRLGCLRPIRADGCEALYPEAAAPERAVLVV